jgi:DNA transposition AAA+ family ATPase
MNNPDDFPVDEAEVHAWLNERRDSLGLSWKQIAAESDIPFGTISNWGAGTYIGNGQNVARRVFKYRQMLDVRNERLAAEDSAGLSNEPGYVETKSGRRLRGLMAKAQTSSAITYAATGSGIGKSKEALNYCGCVAKAYLVTLTPVTTTPTAVMADVIRALGGKAGVNWARQMSAQIMDMVRGKKMLLIVDEANYAEFNTLELFRAWNELAGLGICLLGNEELHATIRTGAGLGRQHSIARLNRRISRGHLQDMSLDEDIEAYLDAWGITDREQRSMLMRVGRTAGTGGLGEIREIISNASELAFEDGQPLSHAYLRDAMAVRSTAYLRHKN